MIDKARAVLSRFWYTLARLLPLDSQLAVYAVWRFEGYGDSPAAIYEQAAQRRPAVRGVWLVTPDGAKQLPEGVPHAVVGSLRYWVALARAKYVVSNFNLPANITKRRGSIHLQVRHGSMVKKAGLDLLTRPAAARGLALGALLKRADRWDYVLSANRFTSEIWERAFPCRFEVLEYGYPSNDMLFTANADRVTSIRAALGLGRHQVAVLYAPTYRDHEQAEGDLPRYRPRFDVARVAEALPANHVLLVRTPRYRLAGEQVDRLRADGRVVDVSAYPHVEHLCLAADVLVADYSSIILDFANLDRPIVCYLDDWDTFRRTRGVYVDLRVHPPGIVVSNEVGLVEALRSGAYATEEATRARAAFRRRYCEYDDGRAAERVVRRVFLGEQPAPPLPLEARTPAPVPRGAERRMAAS